MAVSISVIESACSEDQTSITWHDPMYPHVLNRYSVMHYFEFSPFFDRTSNNSIARRQNLDPAVPGVLESLPPGIEYTLEVEQAPNLFVIRKQMRKEGVVGSSVPAGGNTTVPLAYYYILDKVVYQAPTLHAALTSRLKRCINSLQLGFHRLKRDLDPLQRILKDEEKVKENNPLSKDGVTAIDEEGVNGSSDDPLQKKSSSKSLAAGTAVSTPTAGYSAEEEARWRKAANIIDTVLLQYPLPTLPPEYYKKMRDMAGVAAEQPLEADVNVTTLDTKGMAATNVPKAVSKKGGPSRVPETSEGTTKEVASIGIASGSAGVSNKRQRAS
ncbi:hypothetical protein CEUSTIGMA_g6927.t1 [Chlamydomonas eustigma]|uniref:Mediator of RNA polymerase II transcription subunit 6 n=1 Tax=Chlamydomonas eustigma TaxID=1157962 RepID=A0A250X8U6_9CHLO|nr:hypothetical protein CEUSTIGMA_g6927.t1 [Chlamydomonas eustigma]|eukprot:GAX79486.1 hypothetical protein CEUSTIGMA_g6927.t1 [Chlamydomonas eustigma]